VRNRYWEKLESRVDNLEPAELNAVIQRLNRERKWLSSIFHLLKDAVIVVDHGGIVEFFNESAKHLLGLVEKDIYRLRFWKIIPELAEFFVRKTTTTTALSKQIELHYPKARSVRLYLQPFVHEDSENVKFFVLINDITEDKDRTERRITDEKLDAVVQLTSNVAHELGNPINSMQIHLQLVERQLRAKKLPQTILKSFDVFAEELGRLDGIVKNFLSAVRPTKIVYRSQCVLPVVRRVLTLLQPQLNNLDIRVELHVAPPGMLPPISIDANRVHQALFNVLKNAVEAIGTKGCIHISVDVDGDDVVVAVADSGRGMSPHKTAKIFQKSFSDKRGGNGIGSMIVRRVMQEHDGRVDIETKEGIGTIVSLHFPLRQGRRLKLLPDDCSS
jgi:PAS domain S-box-containing protein